MTKLRVICQCVSIAILLFAGAAWAQVQPPTIVEFTGGPDPTSIQYPVRGFVRCIGAGDPAPADKDMPPWCPAGTFTSVTNRVQTARWVTSDPNTTGNMTWFHNLTVPSATFEGPWWGSFMLSIPGKGMWLGYYSGEGFANGSFQLRLLGQGSGAFEGSTFMAEATTIDPTKPTSITGRYLQPKSK